MDEEEAIANLEAYAAQNDLRLIERAGSGIHGIVYLAEGNAELGTAALKAHYSDEPFRRERDAYERLMEAGITDIRGLEVPALLDSDASCAC